MLFVIEYNVRECSLLSNTMSGNALCYRIQCQGMLSVGEYSLLWNALCLGVDVEPFVVVNGYSFLSFTLFAFRSNHSFIHCLSNYN